MVYSEEPVEITMTPTLKSIQTYLNWTLFVCPSLALWLLTGVFVVPKLQQVSVDAGLMSDGSLWPILHSVIRLNLFATRNAVALLLAGVATLSILEWRSVAWPRHRSAVFGSAAFVLNFVVLVSLFMMMIGFAVAAPVLRHGLK
jgi:hypothetical protein